MDRLEREGDYFGPATGWTGEVPAVFYLLPGRGTDRAAHVISPPHVFTENDDGTLTITASILHFDVERGDWHGCLTNGRWTWDD
jgi:hypothetical protein